MAQKLSNLKAALCKLEVTAGVDPVPTAALDGVLLASIDVSPLEAIQVKRNLIRAHFGGFESLVAGQTVKVTVEMEVAGFGTAGPASPTAGYDALLQSAGFARTITATTKVDYTPASSALKTVALYYYLDGVLHKVLGARAESVQLSFKRNGIPYYKITLVGVYAGVTDVALVSPVLTAYQKPLVVNSANTTLANFLGTAAGIELESLEITIKNTVPYFNQVNSSEEILLTGREITGSAMIRAHSVATKDIWTLIRNGALSAIDLTHGTTAGNKVRVQSSNCDPMNPKYSSMEGVEMLGLDLEFIPVATAGGDDILISVL